MIVAIPDAGELVSSTVQVGSGLAASREGFELQGYGPDGVRVSHVFNSHSREHRRALTNYSGHDIGEHEHSPRSRSVQTDRLAPALVL